MRFEPQADHQNKLFNPFGLKGLFFIYVLSPDPLNHLILQYYKKIDKR